MVYSGPGKKSEVGLFEEVPSVLSCGLFLRRLPSQMFDWILNMPQRAVTKLALL